MPDTSEAGSATSGFPERIKVGHYDFVVEDWTAIDSSRANRYGECDHLKKTIRVARVYGERIAAETLLHEIMHAIFTEWLMKEGDNEERLVSTMSTALCVVWRDNPEAFEWIRQQITV